MEFRVAVFFVFLYYIRPQDWLPGFAGFNVIKPTIALWLLALINNQERRRALSGVFKTPHDWIVLAYFLYAILTAPDIHDAFFSFLPVVVFYYLTVQSLTTWERVLNYLKWTTFMLGGIAAMAVASLYGIDLTGAAAATLANKGRLAIGTYMHNNPNALGHSVVIIIPLSYLLFCWRGSSHQRFFIFPLLAGLAGYCVFRTESKGAFMVGAACLIAGIVIGRPKIVQVVVLGAAMTAGISALSFLPRMNQMDSMKSEQGVQGRLLAWQMARTVTKNFPTGKGMNQFVAWITWQGQTFIKATHSSYVQIAADLGEYGLFFYLAVLWCTGRTLVAVKPLVSEVTMAERCRRATMVLLAGNVLSGWMINREYATEYFLLAAVSASIHRLVKGEEEQVIESKRIEAEKNEPESLADESVEIPDEEIDAEGHTSGAVQYALKWLYKPFWNRFGIADTLASIALVWVVFTTWDYIMTKM